MKTKLEIKMITSENDFNLTLSRKKFVNFLWKHLGKYGDPKEYIDKSINYAFSKSEGKGGFLLAAYDSSNFVGALVMNKTGMDGYVPEYILVYVAIDDKYRNKGFGRQLVEESFKLVDGDIKLHVEYDNPAKNLYERIGMTSKYAEMRYIKKDK